MVWKGLTRDKAAEEAGMKPHSLYVEFRKPHVKAVYLAERESAALSTARVRAVRHRLMKALYNRRCWSYLSFFYRHRRYNPLQALGHMLGQQ